MTEYVLSLDIGTTSVKGVLFDTEGAVYESRLEEYQLIKHGANIVEQDPEVYWTAVKTVIRGILAESDADSSAIMSVGVTSQGETLTVLDESGAALRNSIVWLDNRSQAEAYAIGERFPIEEVYRITGQQEMIPTWTATRILWMKKNEPELFARAAKYLLAADYITYRLTGDFATDRGMNPSTLYFDITTGKWWPEMLEFLGITPTQLPSLKSSGEAVGNISDEISAETGLSTTTVVTTAPIDQIAGAVGAGNIEAGVVTETTGAALAICATSNKPSYDPGMGFGIYLHAIPGLYVMMPWVPTAGMVFRWFRDEFGGGKDYGELCAEAETVAIGADGLTMLPHLAGAGTPAPDANARGAFTSITLNHGRSHFVRAVLESIAFMLRGNLELLEESGTAVKEIRSLGGGAKSNMWLQMKANVCNRTFVTMECDEAASLGVAMLACVGGGIYGNLTEARDRMVRASRSIEPDPGCVEEYQSIYDRYRKLNTLDRSFS